MKTFAGLILLLLETGGYSLTILFWFNSSRYYFSIKPTDALISKFIMVRNATCFG